MARPLRIQRVNGHYHVTSRGNERKAIYRDERHWFQFLELLGQMASATVFVGILPGPIHGRPWHLLLPGARATFFTETHFVSHTGIRGSERSFGTAG